MLLGSLVKGIHQEQSASNSNRNACLPHGGVEVGEGEGVVGVAGGGKAALDGQNVSTYTQLRVEFDWPIPALKPAYRSTSTWPIFTIIQRQNNQLAAHKRKRGFL